MNSTRLIPLTAAVVVLAILCVVSMSLNDPGDSQSGGTHTSPNPGVVTPNPSTSDAPPSNTHPTSSHSSGAPVSPLSAGLTEDTDRRRVTGRVVRRNGLPVPHAMVLMAHAADSLGEAIRSAADANRQSWPHDRVSTDDQGAFTLPPHPTSGPSSWNLLYIESQQRDMLTVDLTTRPVGHVDLGDLTLDVQAALVGRVTSSSGKAIEDAQVTISYHPTPERPAPPSWGPTDPGELSKLGRTLAHPRTDSMGLFRVRGMPSGFVRVRVDHPLHGSVDRRGIALKAGTTTDLEDIPLPTTNSLRGRVLTPAGAPASGANVFVQLAPVNSLSGHDPPGRNRGTTTTRADGRFEVHGLKPGEYTAHAFLPGWTYTTFPGLHTEAPDVELTLQVGSRIELRVVDALSSRDVDSVLIRTGLPKGALVGQPMFADRYPVATEVTSGSPLRVITHVGSAGVSLSLSAVGYADMSLEIMPSSDDQVIVRTVSLSPQVVLVGVVQGTDGAGIESASVQARFIDGLGGQGAPVHARTDRNGAYRLTGLQPGRWEIVSTATGYVPVRIPVLRLPLAPGDVHAITLEQRASLAGIVQDHRGAAVPFGRVTCLLSELAMASDNPDLPAHLAMTEHIFQADDNGRFQLESIAPGTWHLLATPAESGHAEAWRTLLVASGRREPLDAPTNLSFEGITVITIEEGVHHDVLVRSMTPGRATGRVTSYGHAVQGCRVTALLETDSKWPIMGFTTTDGTGQYTLPGLPPGSYRLVVWRPKDVVPWEAPVRIEPTLDSLADLVLEGGSLTGQVIDAKSQAAVDDVTVCLRKVKDVGGNAVPTRMRFPSLAASLGRKTHASLRVDADGRFRGQGLPAGEYVVGICVGTAWAIETELRVRVRLGNEPHLLLEVRQGARWHGEVRRTPPTPSITDWRPYMVEFWKAGEWQGAIEVEDGKYAFSGLSAGMYEARLVRRSGQELVTLDSVRLSVLMGGSVSWYPVIP